MNRLREIELKMPEMRMPVFLSDLFYDLRERRLLPLVALLLVALVAAPFLLSSSGSDSEEGSEPAPPAGASGARASDSRLTVVETDHGLREPRKRLGHLTAKDPFHQQYTGPAQGAAQVSQTSTSTSETSTSTTVTTDTTSNSGGGASPGTTSPSGSSGNGGGGDSSVAVFTFAIDLKIVKTVPTEGGGKTKGEPETRKRVLPPATLPGEKTQVLTYMGISPEGKKPLFLVSSDVSAVFGEADCVSGQGTCQVLEAEPGFPLTVVYGPNDVRYKFTVLKVEPVATGHF
jgi:hypothetical protein